MKISWGVRPPWSLHWRDIRWRYLDGREYVANIQNLEVDKSYIQYSSKSAYAIQFAGSYCTFNSTAIWKAKTEGKHRFFGWLFLQQKIQTADNLTLKGIPCDPQCCLCDQAPESAAHLCLQCPFAQEVWFLVHVWTEGLIAMPSSDAHVEDWWDEALWQKSFCGCPSIHDLEYLERKK